MTLIRLTSPQINERVSTEGHTTPGPVKTYGLKTLNGELAPWRLHPRGIALPEYTHTSIEHLMILEGGLPRQDWLEYFQGRSSILLPASSTHTLHVRAEVHSTALLTWAFRASQTSRFHMRITYSEGYEHEPRTYPFFRTKSDRLNPQDMQLIGPYDEIDVDLPPGEVVVYEPFWFRTFRLLKVEIQIDAAEVELMSFAATQMNYPITSVGFIDIPSDAEAKLIWDVSVRTMRNCMLDGYSDCPFYEQLQYIGDSRTVGLFHYLISGDGQLMRKTIASFGASILTEGLPQSRFPSHVPQIIAGFALYWVLQVRDHHLHFGDGPFARSFLPRIDGVLDYFDAHVSSDTGLVVGLHPDLWQFVDWVTAWGATETHPDKGVPVAGRMSNTHTYFSMLYAYTLRQAAMLVAEVGRPALASEYVARADALVQAIRRHCYDGTFFTDSTVSESKGYPYSQHCQAWGVLCGAVRGSDASRIMAHCFLTENDFSKCSYMMMFYAFRAMAAAGDKVYESYWSRAWDPWQRMLANNLTTWEEDDVRQRSDCHAWGSVPLYEYCTELAGIHILSPGSKKIHFKPRIRLAPVVRARVALGDDNHATVEWLRDGSITKINLRLRHPIEIISQIPDRMTDHGVTDQVTLEYAWSKD